MMSGMATAFLSLCPWMISTLTRTSPTLNVSRMKLLSLYMNEFRTFRTMFFPGVSSSLIE